MNKTRTIPAILALASTACLAAAQEVYELAPVTVTGDLLGTTPGRLPASVSILRPDMDSVAGSSHLEDLAGRVPNLTYAGGTSRARFFQIRGIGEISQFGNELPASSVGLLIDGIDFTGIGSVAGLFDVEQVEVLRGPQAAAYGANALAGMVLVQTAEPTPTPRLRMATTIGTDELVSFGIAVGGPLGTNSTPLTFRISASQHRDNGFRDNTFLDRDDTNGRDERSAKLKLAWRPASAFAAEFTLLWFDMDNGYDAWSLTGDNFTTTTDEPGRDRQESLAAGLKASWHLNDDLDLTYRASLSDSDLYYGFDWDWSNPQELMRLYGPEVYYGTDETTRWRTVHSHDLRLATPDSGLAGSLVSNWAAGLYYRDFEEEQDYFALRSAYSTRTAALYGQARLEFTGRLGLTTAARLEDLDIGYTDDTGARLGGSENQWGGKLALEFTPASGQLLYASVDRGFKAGGVNIDNRIPQAFRVYDTETLVNFELGWKAFLPEHRLRLQLVAFHMDRQDIQVDSSIQTGDGMTFALYKDNAASGHNYGAELELEWEAVQGLRFSATLGLLEAAFDDFHYLSPGDGSTEIVLDGRSQAYAPAFTWSAGVDYTAENGLFLGFSVEGRDKLLFDVVNDQTLAGHTLAHLRAGFRKGDWTVSVWVRNLLDRGYEGHAFYFANEPPLYDQPRKWVSQGAPRQAGLSVEWRH